MTTWKFWLEALERSAKSAAQGAIAVMGLAEAELIQAVDWRAFAGGAAFMAVLSLLTSVASAPVGPSDTPSIT